MNTEDLTEKLVGALLDMVPSDQEAQLKLMQLQRDWLIYVLDTIVNTAEHGSAVYDIATEAQAAIPSTLYVDAVDRFMPDDAKPIGTSAILGSAWELQDAAE